MRGILKLFLFSFKYSFIFVEKTNKDVVDVLEFDDRIIYELIVQAPDHDFLFEETLKTIWQCRNSIYVS